MKFRAVIVVLTLALAGVAASGVIAQTLIEPNSKLRLSKPSGLAKSQPALRTKACGSFGAEFVQIPGTDTCIKIGGFVTTEGGVNRGR
jgi:hypothetical protein